MRRRVGLFVLFVLLGPSIFVCVGWCVPLFSNNDKLTHQGDLVIPEGEKYTISDCTFEIDGRVHVYGSLIIENATFRSTYDYGGLGIPLFFGYDKSSIAVRDSSIEDLYKMNLFGESVLKIENSISKGIGLSIHVHDQSSMSIVGSILNSIKSSDSASLSVVNSTVEYLLYMEGDSSTTVTNSQIGVMDCLGSSEVLVEKSGTFINVGDRASIIVSNSILDGIRAHFSESKTVLTSLPSGEVAKWNIFSDNFVQTSNLNITLINSRIQDDWQVEFAESYFSIQGLSIKDVKATDSEVFVSNSAIWYMEVFKSNVTILNSHFKGSGFQGNLIFYGNSTGIIVDSKIDNDLTVGYVPPHLDFQNDNSFVGASNSTIGKIWSEQSAVITLLNCTLAGNHTLDDNAAIYVQHFLGLRCLMENQPIERAVVSIYYLNGSFVTEDTTDFNGFVRFALLKEILRETGREYVGNYMVVASYNDMTIGTKEVVLDQSRTIVLTGGSLQVEVEGVRPEAIILYDSNWKEIDRVSPSGNAYTFFGLTPGIYYVEAYSYDMWIGEALNVEVKKEQTSTIKITAHALKPVNVTVYYSDGVTPLSEAKLRIYSYDGYSGGYNYRAEIMLDTNGKISLPLWPTSKDGEHYRILVLYDGEEVDSNSNVTVDKDVGGEVFFVTSVPFEGRRISPEHISLIPQETEKSCWAASSLMILKYYGTYGELPSQIQLARQLGWLGEWYYWNGIFITELIPVIGQWEAAMERLGKLDFDRELPDPITQGLTFEKVKSDIDLSRPIIALYARHTVVIAGYIDKPGTDIDKVVLYNPWPPGEGDVQTILWKDVELNPICNAIRTKGQTIEGTILTLQESQHKLYLHVYDSQQRHIGMNYALNTAEIEIPDAKYLEYDTTTMIFLPSSVSEFRYVVDAKYATNATEEYKLIVTSLREGTLLSEIERSGVISRDSEIENMLYIAAGGNLSETKAPWWEEHALCLILGLILILVAFGSISVLRRKDHRRTTSSL